MLLSQIISTWFDPRLYSKLGTKTMRQRLQTQGNSIGENSNPLTIEKPVEPMPKIPKGVFKKTLHNPNARAAANYFVVEDLA